MHFWNNHSVVSKEAFSWRCINFSDFFNFSIHKKLIRESFMNLFFVTPDGRCEGNIPLFSWIILSLRFLGIIIRKGFSKKAKITEISAFSENWFSGNKTQLIYKGHWMTSEAYFIKWTTSGKPPVCLKNPLCFYFRSYKHQLSEGSNLTPCIYNSFMFKCL